MADPWESFNPWLDPPRPKLNFEPQNFSQPNKKLLNNNHNNFYHKPKNSCPCYDGLCHYAKVKKSEIIDNFANLYDYPITKKTDKLMDSYLEYKCPDLRQFDLVLFRRDDQFKNFVYIERIINRGPLPFIDDEYLEDYNDSDKEIAQQIKSTFIKNFSQTKNGQAFFDKRSAKRPSELYAGRPVIIYHNNQTTDTDKKKNSAPIYQRASLTHIQLSNIYDKENFINFKLRTANCLLIDNYKEFLINVPFSHILFIDGSDKKLLQEPSKSKWVLVDNFKDLPDTKYFFGEVQGRKFLDIYKRPSFNLKVGISPILDLKLKKWKSFNSFNFSTLVSSKFVYPVGQNTKTNLNNFTKFPKNPNTKVTSVNTVPKNLFKGNCYIRFKKLDYEDYEIHNNRALMGLDKNRNFPCGGYTSGERSSFYRHFEDCVVVGEEAIEKSFNVKKIKFASIHIKNQVHQLNLTFEYVICGAVKGFHVKNKLEKTEKSLTIPAGSTLVEILDRDLIFELPRRDKSEEDEFGISRVVVPFR